jgi:hypothetical protein
LAALALALLIVSGCASRSETPFYAEDSTRVYPGLKPGDVTATVTFCERYERDSGQRIDVGRMFEINERRRVWAIVDLENPLARGSRPLDFHLVWLWPDASTLYAKRLTYTPSEEDRPLVTNISIAPERRDPGRYAFQVYLFRELIAEKTFELN